jgi:hypothetical protein
MRGPAGKGNATPTMTRELIPVAAPMLVGNEKAYVMDCLESTWISSTGQYIDRFERAFAEFCGVKHASAPDHGRSLPRGRGPRPARHQPTDLGGIDARPGPLQYAAICWTVSWRAGRRDSGRGAVHRVGGLDVVEAVTQAEP